jgi:hypothetical protein
MNHILQPEKLNDLVSMSFCRQASKSEVRNFGVLKALSAKDVRYLAKLSGDGFSIKGVRSESGAPHIKIKAVAS